MPGPNSADTERRAHSDLGGRHGHGDEGRHDHGDEGNRDVGVSGEFEVIGRLVSALAGRGGMPGPGETWIGDDAAVVAVPGSGRMVLTTDLVVAGVHGDLSLMSVADLGWRAMVASLSDVAAMGAGAGCALVSVAGPPDTDLESLADGVAEAASEFGCPVVGGDLSSASQLVVSVAMTGVLVAGAEPVLRSGARPGDRIFVTGPVGASAAGLRLLREGSPGPDVTAAVSAALSAAYRRPRPLLRHGVAAGAGGAGAMVDVSDGLAGDLGHLADASEVGFELDEIPVSEGAVLDDALYGGEDYQLVLACSDVGRLRDAFERAELAPPFEIGMCVADRARRTCGGRLLGAGAYEHRFEWGGRERGRRPT